MTRKLQKKLHGPMDQVSSALAINCCQLGYGIQDIPLAEYSHDNSDWMTKLTEVAPSTKLRDLVIPGTHDSASSTIGKLQPFAAVGRTQNLSVAGQLKQGARYLDIRVGGDGTEKEGISIYHGFLKGGKFASVLDEIVAFIDANPGEFVFLEIVLEYGRAMSEEQRVFLFDLIKLSLGERMVDEEDKKSWFKNGRVTLGDIAQRKKNFVVLLHNRIYGFTHNSITFDANHVKETYGYFDVGRNIRNKWHNTRDLDALLKSNEEELELHGTKPNTFLNSSYVFTPGVGGAGDIPAMLFGIKSLRPVSFARVLYKYDVLDDHIRGKADEPWNLVTFDFIDLCPALTCFLIGLNFPGNLKVHEATATPVGGDPVDVTEKIQSFIKRGGTIYLTNIQKDLELESVDGDLMVQFQYDGDEKKKHTISFDEDTAYVLCPYCQNEGDHCCID